MIRKMLVIAAAVAMPASALAAGAIGSGVAGAAVKPLPPTPINCAASGTITFAGAGLSVGGNTTTATTSATTTTATTFSNDVTNPSVSNCTTGGSSPGNTITSKNSKCSGNGTGSPKTVLIPGCVKTPKTYYYGTAASYAATGAKTLGKALKNVTLVVNGTTFTGTTKKTAQITGGACGTEAGFLLSGVVTTTPSLGYKDFSMLVCIGTDHGTDVSGSFLTDMAGEMYSNATSIFIQSADIDPSTSTLNIH